MANLSEGEIKENIKEGGLRPLIAGHNDKPLAEASATN